MPQDMSPLFKDGPTAPPQSWLDTVERLAKIFAIVAIPIVIPIALAIYSAKVQAGAQEQTINRDYVQLAVSLLKEKKVDVDAGIRDWAVDLLAEHSPTKFKPEVIAALKSGAVSLPTQNNLPTNEVLSSDNKLAKADSLGIQIIDTQTGKRKFMLETKSDVSALEFSHRGDLLAVGFVDHTLSTYKMDTGAKVFEAHLMKRATATSILFDDDDRGIAVHTTQYNIRYNVATDGKLSVSVN